MGTVNVRKALWRGYLFLEMFGAKLDSPVYNSAEKRMQDRIEAFKAITDSLPWTAQSGISRGH